MEVKSVSRDKGRKIHKRDALVFNHFVRERLEAVAQRLPAGLAAILTVPERLPAPYRERQNLADHVRTAIVRGSGATLQDGSDIRLVDFDIHSFLSCIPR